MTLYLEIITKIPHEQVAKALNEFVNISFKKTGGKSVSKWEGKDGYYALSISYAPENRISDKMLQMALEGSFRKQDETATVKKVKVKEVKASVQKKKAK